MGTHCPTPCALLLQAFGLRVWWSLVEVCEHLETPCISPARDLDSVLKIIMSIGTVRHPVEVSSVCAELMLVESGGRLRVPGESVHLSCWGSDFNFAIYSVLWYRQALGGSLQWLSYINPDSSYIRYGSAVKGRATASRDNSKSKTALTLNNLHLQDSARYFCAVHTGTGNLAEL
uniref:Ig-like domain-containing protein n=1 Tax=Anas platyrhynchos TaxID=8839 RepID=A0A8B9SHN4_ANAPL